MDFIYMSITIVNEEASTIITVLAIIFVKSM